MTLRALLWADPDLFFCSFPLYILASENDSLLSSTFLLLFMLFLSFWNGGFSLPSLEYQLFYFFWCLTSCSSSSFLSSSGSLITHLLLFVHRFPPLYFLCVFLTEPSINKCKLLIYKYLLNWKKNGKLEWKYKTVDMILKSSEVIGKNWTNFLHHIFKRLNNSFIQQKFITYFLWSAHAQFWALPTLKNQNQFLTSTSAEETET